MSFRSYCFLDKPSLYTKLTEIVRTAYELIWAYTRTSTHTRMFRSSWRIIGRVIYIYTFLLAE